MPIRFRRSWGRKTRPLDRDTAVTLRRSLPILFLRRPGVVKPRIYGPQTAKVVAASGEEMHIDKLGRVNVQFMWDKLRHPNTVDNTWVQEWRSNGLETDGKLTFGHALTTK